MKKRNIIVVIVLLLVVIITLVNLMSKNKKHPLRCFLFLYTKEKRDLKPTVKNINSN